MILNESLNGEYACSHINNDLNPHSISFGKKEDSKDNVIDSLRFENMAKHPDTSTFTDGVEVNGVHVGNYTTVEISLEDGEMIVDEIVEEEEDEDVKFMEGESLIHGME